MLDVDRVREVFESSRDFTVGIEEEFAILDPETRSLTQRFEALQQAARDDQVLAESVAGELISSEIESARAAARHYRRFEDYVAWRSNTFSLHVHVGIRGADRAVAVCERLRATLPELLAISANSPFLHGRDSGLHSAACIAQAALDRDDGALPEPPPNRLIEENLWRAIRYGLDGSMILERGEELPAAALADRLLAWTEPARTALAIDPQLPAENGAQRQRRALERGDPLDEIYAAEVDDTRRTYAADAPVDTGSCTALPEQ